MGDFDTTMELAAEAAMEALGPESVTYTPLGGVARVIDVLIRRAVPDAMLDVPAAVITCRNHAALGIGANAVNTGGDTIAWPPKRGGSTRTSRITEIVEANGGFVIVEVR